MSQKRDFSELDDNNDNSHHELKKKDKKLKKAAKKAKKLNDNSVITGNADQDDNELSKKEKKHKKDKKEKKSKKDKKEKSNEDNGTADNVDILRNSSSLVNLYVPHASTVAMPTNAAKSFRESKGIAIYPSEIAAQCNPMTEFSHLNPSLAGKCDYISQYLRNKNFPNPTPIQSQCWPLLLEGRDLVGIAATGSGKTLAFLIPGILRMTTTFASSNNRNYTPAPKILIVAPTRELAMQSHQVVEELNGPKGVCIYGGVPKHIQKNSLRNGAEIVVATPGRLIDLLDEQALSLSEVCYLVLDEADRMLDEGFAPAINQIVTLCDSNNPKRKRQTVMFSATWPEEIRELASKYLDNSKGNLVRVTVGSDELSANHRVQQIVECVKAFEKDKKLMDLLKNYHKSRTNRILIFVLYKREAAELHTRLEQRGFNVTSIHGDKSQQDRTNALEEFKQGRVPLLIATDVAARGLDIPQVEYVINYSFPLTVEDYVHRIGRTGRGGASGISHTFFTDFDKGLAGALVAVLQEAGQEVPQSIYQYPLVTKKKQSKLYGDFGPKADLIGKKATKITFD